MCDMSNWRQANVTYVRRKVGGKTSTDKAKIVLHLSHHSPGWKRLGLKLKHVGPLPMSSELEVPPRPLDLAIVATGISSVLYSQIDPCLF